MLFSYISSVLFKRVHCCLDTSADIFCRGEIASYDIISRLLVSGIYGRWLRKNAKKECVYGIKELYIYNSLNTFPKIYKIP